MTNVRIASASDLAGLERLAAKCHGQAAVGGGAELLGRALAPRGATMSRVLERSGELRGFLLGELQPDGVDPIAHIEALIVEATTAADGTCRRLLEEALAAAKQAGASRALAVCGHQHEAVVEVFEALGFRLSDLKMIERAL